MGHESAQVELGLVLHAWTRSVGLCLFDEVPLRAVLIVPVVAHFGGLFHYKRRLNIGFLAGISRSLVKGVSDRPEPMQ